MQSQPAFLLNAPIVKSPRRTSSRQPSTYTDSEDDAVLYGASSADEQDHNRRRTTITGRAMHPSASRVSESPSIQSQLSQPQSQGRPQTVRPLRSRSTTAPPSSPESGVGFPSMSLHHRSGLPLPLRTSSSSRSPAVLSMHSANGSVSTVSTSQTQSSRSVRSRSQTESSGYGTSITRPSTDSFSTTGRKSTSSARQYPSLPPPPTQYHQWSRPSTAPSSPDLSRTTFTAPFPISNSDLLDEEVLPSLSAMPKSISEAQTGWKAMARKASGRFRRSTSTHNIPMDISFSAGSYLSQTDLSRSTSSSLSPNPPRSRSKTVVSAPSSDAETDGSTGSGGLLGGFLSRKKSSNSLRAEKAERNRAWSQMPLPDGMSSSPSSMSIGVPSPTQAVPERRTLKTKSSKLSIGTGKGKQRLDEVVVSPFDVHFHSSASSSGPLKKYTNEPEEMSSRPSLSTSLRPQTPPPSFRRSISHNSGSTARQPATLRALMPRSQSTNSTASSSSPCSPASSQALSPSLSTASLTTSSSFAWNEDADLPPVPRVPEQHRSESPGPKSLRFPTSFGFVPRGSEDQDEFGSSASAASIPIPLMKRLESEKIKEKKVLDFDAMLEDKSSTIKISVGSHGQFERHWL